jgi:hypothetical protein
MGWTASSEQPKQTASAVGWGWPTNTMGQTTWVDNQGGSSQQIKFNGEKIGLCMWISAYLIVKKKNISQWSTPLLGVRFCRHIPYSPSNENKMLYNPCLFIKVVFWAFKLCCSSLAYTKKASLSTWNVMISQMVWIECARFGGHIDIEVSYKIL